MESRPQDRLDLADRQNLESQWNPELLVGRRDRVRLADP